MEQRRVERRSNGLRSRLGCLTCRRRHKKCDEQKPVCGVCHRSNRQCEYAPDFRWATVNQPNAAATYKSRNGTCPSNTRQRPSRQRSDGASPEPEVEQANLNSGITPSANLFVLSEPPANDSSSLQHHDSIYDTWVSSLMELSSWDLTAPGELGPSSGAGLNSGSMHELQLSPLDRAPPFGRATGELDPEQQTVRTSETGSPVADSEGWELNHGLGSLLSSTLGSPSEEIAYTYYIHHASARIPAYDGPQNPYRRLCIISLSYPLLLHTILYVSTVSMYNHGRSHSDLIANRRSHAWTLLRNALSFLEQEKKDKPQESRLEMTTSDQSLSVLSVKEVTLAAFLMHIVTEVMSGSSTAEAHLKSAYQLMTELDYVERLPESYYARFLVERFAIVDVVLSILRRRKPIAPMEFTLYQPCDGIDNSDPSFRELTGCPQLVLTFLARIACLAHDVATSAREISTIIEEAYEMENELRQWWKKYSVLMISREGSGRGDNPNHLNILSECFYWTASLLLARRVFRDPTASPRVQYFRQKLFNAMDRLPTGCGPDSSLPFPFYMAAREAITPEDRAWVRRKHAEMMEIYRDRARETMMNLTEEIWTKADERLIAATENMFAGPGVLVNDTFIHVLDSRAAHFVF